MDEDGYDVVDVVFSKLSVFAKGKLCPTKESLADFVTRLKYPYPHEIKKVVQVTLTTYRLWIRRDPCPVLFFGGDVCPMCGESHAHDN